MDVDQLRMILDTVKDLGEAGKSAFLWWLVLEKSPAILCSILIPASFGFIAWAIYKYHKACGAYRVFAQEVFSVCNIRHLLKICSTPVDVLLLLLKLKES